MKYWISLKSSFLAFLHVFYNLIENEVHCGARGTLQKNNRSSTEKALKALFSPNSFAAVGKSSILIRSTASHHHSPSNCVWGVGEADGSKSTYIAYHPSL